MGNLSSMVGQAVLKVFVFKDVSTRKPDSRLWKGADWGYVGALCSSAKGLSVGIPCFDVRYPLQRVKCLRHPKNDISRRLARPYRGDIEHPMVSLRQEIAQEPPFSSLEEEAFLNLLRTSDSLQRALHRRTRDWGITSTQYNVLRILRGAQPDGLTCAAIGDRMITAEPDITRLLRRLKALKLIRQRRDRHDRRAVWTQISEAGLELLKAMDPVIPQVPQELLGHMNQAELMEFIRLLEMARKATGDAQVALHCDCDGKPVAPGGAPAQPSC